MSEQAKKIEQTFSIGSEMIQSRTAAVESKGAFPFRHNCKIENFTPGNSILSGLGKDLKAAQSSIDILVWGFNPALNLMSGAKKSSNKNRLGQILIERSINNNVKVRIRTYALVQVGLTLANAPILPTVTYFRDLFQKLGDIRSNYMYYTKWMADIGRYPNIDFASFVPDNAAIQREIEKYHKLRVENKVGVRDDIFEEDYVIGEAMEHTSSAHQKCVLIDYENPAGNPCAYVMGNNLKLVDWDDAGHTSPEGPRHDVACRVEGAILDDINKNFVDVYNRTKPKIPLNRKPLPFSTTNKPNYHDSLQLCRTFPQNAETAIHKLYINMIKSVDVFVYIENQYFRHNKIVKALIDRIDYLKAKSPDKKVYIFIVLDTAGIIGKATTDVTLAELKAGVKKLKGSANASVCMLATPDSKHRPISVHSKVLIVDDVDLTIGSANLHYRGMLNDTELNVFCQSETKAEKLRHKLMGKHMGSVDIKSLNIEELFQEWEDMREENDERKVSGSPFYKGSKILTYVDDSYSVAVD